MKKIILALAAVILSMGLVSAQDMAKATETYNNGATALTMGDKAGALKYFQDALTMGEAIGAEASELVTNCKNAIPGIILSIGKDMVNNQQFDEAIAKIKEAEKKAQEYGVQDVADECKTLIPQIELQKELIDANKLFDAKNIKGAAEKYKKILAIDSTNAAASVRIIQCYAEVGDFKTAESYMKLAEANGQGDNASKVLGVGLLKSAVANLKVKKFQDAIDDAIEADKFVSNPQAYLIAGQAATKLNKNADAIKYFEQYLEGAPKAKNAGAIALTIGALYQGQNNKAKAIEFYKKAQSLGQNTQQYIDALSK